MGGIYYSKFDIFLGFSHGPEQTISVVNTPTLSASKRESAELNIVSGMTLYKCERHKRENAEKDSYLKTSEH